ncbi:TrkA-C domain protein [compost metagenome]
MPAPRELVGRTLAECGLRQNTGCNLLAIRHNDRVIISPEATMRIPPGAKLVLIGDREAEARFFARYRA